MQAEDKNAIIFTFDMMNIASYERFLKRALKAFIYEREQLPESLKHRRHIPFMVLGMKKDMISKSKIV